MNVTITVPVITTSPDHEDQRDDRTVEAYTTSNWPEIAIHPDVVPRRRLSTQPWTLTHVPTGRMIGQAPSRSAAIEIARRLSKLDVEWSTLTAAVAARLPADVKYAIRDAFYKSGGWLGRSS